MGGPLGMATAGWSAAVLVAVAGAVLQGSSPRVALGAFVAAVALAAAVAGLTVVVGARDSVAYRRLARRGARRTRLDRLNAFAGPDEIWLGATSWGLTAIWGRPAPQRQASFVDGPRIMLIGRGRPVPLHLVRRLEAGTDEPQRRLA